LQISADILPNHYRFVTGHAFVEEYTQRCFPQHTPEQVACPCGAAVQTVEHMLLRCPIHTTARLKHLTMFGRPNNLSQLFANPKRAVESSPPFFRRGLWTPVWRAAVEENVNIIHLEKVCQRASSRRLGGARQRSKCRHSSDSSECEARMVVTLTLLSGFGPPLTRDSRRVFGLVFGWFFCQSTCATSTGLGRLACVALPVRG
jgi:hypothetical protein